MASLERNNKLGFRWGDLNKGKMQRQENSTYDVIQFWNNNKFRNIFPYIYIENV